MKKFLLLSVFCLSSVAHCAELKTNYLTFGITGRIVELQHFEASDAANFTALAKKITIPTFSFRLGAEKEFLAEEVVSFNASVGGGGLFGRSKDDIVARNLTYRDKASGYFYGAGGSVNYNFKISKMRSQVFGGAHFLKSNSKYKLSYEPMSASTPAFNIDYSEDGTQSFVTCGMRFFDAKTELFSFFMLEYELSSNFETKVETAKINQEKINLLNPTDVSHKPYAVTLGFGATF